MLYTGITNRLKTMTRASLVLEHLKDPIHICLPNNMTQLPSLFMASVNDKDEYIAGLLNY